VDYSIAFVNGVLTVSPSLRNRMIGVVAQLNALIPTGDKKLDKDIQQALQQLSLSLDAKFWLDDNHLGHAGGSRCCRTTRTPSNSCRGSVEVAGRCAGDRSRDSAAHGHRSAARGDVSLRVGARVPATRKCRVWTILRLSRAASSSAFNLANFSWLAALIAARCFEFGDESFMRASRAADDF